MGNVFIQSFHCPHCDTKCQFIGYGYGDSIVLYCGACGKGVYFKLTVPIQDNYTNTNTTVKNEYIADYYPKRKINLDKSIPEDVAGDFLEANNCYQVNAPKATVAMCRRTLQNTCLSAGANPKIDLILQIDELENKRVINKGLQDIAHTIRVIGNWGAHPQEDNLKDVTPEDALEILRFTNEFLEEVFVRPARVVALKTKKGIK